MRVYGPSSTRAYPTDRNPATIAQGTSAGPAAPQQVNVANYTVPAGRRARLTAQIGGTVRVALGAAQDAQVQVQVTPSGGGVQTVDGAITAVAAPAGTQFAVSPLVLELKAGDNVLVFVSLGAGVGGVLGIGGIAGVEYDA